MNQQAEVLITLAVLFIGCICIGMFFDSFLLGIGSFCLMIVHKIDI